MNEHDAAELRRLEEQALILDSTVPPEAPAPAPPTLSEFGIVNRRTARRAGLRNPKKRGSMAVPRSRR